MAGWITDLILVSFACSAGMEILYVRGGLARENAMRTLAICSCK